MTKEPERNRTERTEVRKWTERVTRESPGGQTRCFPRVPHQVELLAHADKQINDEDAE